MENGAKKNDVAKFHELKAKHPDAIILFRTGDFYMAYEKDAMDMSSILGLNYSRTTDGMAVAGFPNIALETYLPMIVRANRRVAISDALAYQN